MNQIRPTPIEWRGAAGYVRESFPPEPEPMCVACAIFRGFCWSLPAWFLLYMLVF